ncbi:MAG: hypothetical protein IT372_16105 [Polyangiaceae bacterium]|nr:hypothetical protein [Polyangiaceae bacterium]
MSRKQAGLISAALRHVRVAEHLLDAGTDSSPDEAYYLAGYGPECARKATLSIRWLDQAVGHGGDAAAEDVRGLAVSLDPLARRYDSLAEAARWTTLAKWRVDVRYEKTGTRGQPEAKAVTEEAREVVDAVVIALWADGRFPDGETPW